MVRISYTTPDGAHHRDRKVPDGITSRTAAERWGHERLALLLGGKGEAKAIVPTLAEFWPRYMEGYVKANRQKHSEVLSKDSIYRNHLGPMFGARRLDTLSDEDVQALKGALAARSPSTLNNVLTVLRKMLKVAVKWRKTTGLAVMPCDVEGVKVQKRKMGAYEPEVLERLIEAARMVDSRAELVALLGAEAGLRSGEMIGLEWGDIDFKAGRISIQRTVYRKVIGPTKGWETRTIPFGGRLAAALKAERRSITNYPVLMFSDKRCDPWQLRDWMGRAQRIAGITEKSECQVGKEGRLHILRHTFGSALVRRGVDLLTVKELMGHKDVKTTMRYLHLLPGSKEAAIAALNSGNVAATAPSGSKNLRRIR